VKVKKQVLKDIRQLFKNVHAKIKELKDKTILDVIVTATKEEFEVAMLKSLINEDKKAFEKKINKIKAEQRIDTIDPNARNLGNLESLLG